MNTSGPTIREAPVERRVAAYVDGFNLYYGLKSKGWRRFYWLDIRALLLAQLSMLGSESERVARARAVTRMKEHFGI